MTEKPFKKLRGYRVYLIAPEVATGKIQLTNEAKKSIAKSRIQDFMRLRVYAVGENVTDIQEGDEVLVGDVALNNAPIIDLTENVSVIVINANDIIHIW